MLRFSSSLGLTIFVALVACSSSSDPQAANLVDGGSTRTLPCGGKTCRNDEYCCGSTGWADATCSSSCGDKHAIYCHDGSDCPEGNVCCFSLEGGNSIVDSQCANTCAFLEDRGQLCTEKTGDCKNGKCTALNGVAPAGYSQCILN